MKPLTFRNKPITLQNIKNYIKHLMRKYRWRLCPRIFQYHWEYLWSENREPYNSFADHNGYFSDKTERIKNISNKLVDKKSKYIYQSIIKFRKSISFANVPLNKMTEKQYFLKEMNLGKDETFIDCGGFIGDTIDDFIAFCGDFRQIISFEPDRDNFQILSDKYGNHPKITLINAGVYDEETTLYFNMKGNSCSHLQGSIAKSDDEEVFSVPVKKIDDLGLDKVTFIKMDIEGAELRALKGAEKTLLRDKPKLAISIYHKHEDFIEIPEYLHTLIPEYRFYVRQYAILAETVLYAIV